MAFLQEVPSIVPTYHIEICVLYAVYEFNNLLRKYTKGRVAKGLFTKYVIYINLIGNDDNDCLHCLAIV